MCPPDLAENSWLNPKHMMKYLAYDDKDRIPRAETKTQAHNRVVTYWTESIAPQVSDLDDGSSVLIVAQNTMVQSLVRHFLHRHYERMDDLEVGHAEPLVLEMNKATGMVRRGYLLNDEKQFFP